MPFNRETLFILFSIPFYTLIIGIEILLSNWQHKKFYSTTQTLQNIYLTIINASLDIFLRWAFYISVLSFCYLHHFIKIHNAYAYWIALFFLEDLAFYAEHRVDHFCRIFWAVHVTHHSSPEYNLSTGFRSSVFQPVYRFIYLMPLALMGFHPMDIVFMYSLTQTYGIIVHTQYINKMPRWFEFFFVSPSHHRVHHASNVIYLDKNMGMCLIIWDKIFGTFQQELSTTPIKFGIAKPIVFNKNLIKIIFHEWQNIATDLKRKIPLSLKLKYLFMPPGWSHDGSSKTSKQLREEL